MNEIMVMKQGGAGDWSEGELMDGAGGGSEPCLGTVEVTIEDSLTKKRSVSTGDIDLGLETVEAGKLYPQVRRGGEDKRQSLPSLDREHYMASIQELNEDTISSLRQFINTASVQGMGDNMKSWLENNVPGIRPRLQQEDNLFKILKNNTLLHNNHFKHKLHF